MDEPATTETGQGTAANTDRQGLYKPELERQSRGRREASWALQKGLEAMKCGRVDAARGGEGT